MNRILPLSGITVIALEQAVAAPFATRQLADWGARVIKVERPGTGDFARHYDTTVKGLSSHFVWINRGKESLCLDLKTPEGMMVLRSLIGKGDVLIQNLRPGALTRLGLDGKALARENPRLIICNISGYGPDGPYRHRKAYDLLVQAESGLLSITGSPEMPSKVGISVADIAAGMYALTGILTAIIQRSTTGTGNVVDVSMFEAVAEWMGYPLNFTHYGQQSPRRTGAHHATIAPYGPYPVAGDDEVFLGIENEREWKLFCAIVLQQPALSSEARFSTNAGRVAHRVEMDAVIHSVISQLDFEEVVARLEHAGIAYARMNSVEDLWEHPQLHARQRWADVSTEMGSIQALMPPVSFADLTARMGPVPQLGQHTDTILEELGWTAEVIGDWKMRHII